MWYFYKESIFNEEIVTKRFYNFHGLATMRTMNIQKDTISQHLSFKKGDYIFKKGDMRDHAFIIIDGSVAIITQSHTGAESIGSMLSAGDIFGEMALMEPGVRTAAARATADTDVYAISRAGVKERISGMDPIISTLFSLLIDRYRKTRIYLPESADLPDPEHVIQHLRNLAQLEKDIEAPTPETISHEIFGNIAHQRKSALEELDMEQKIINALRYDEMKAWLQPVVDIQTKKPKVIGFEALVRWHDRDGNIIMPFEFLPFAERLQMIGSIDYAILDQACAFIHQWKKKKLFVSTNLSGLHFKDESIVGMIEKILEDQQADPANLKVEVTETSLIDDPDQAQAILFKLKDLGVQIALDDFGTGYSSLSYLHKFPIDVLKIDRSFVSRLTHDKRSVDIIRAIVTMAQGFQMQVIAEGIETEAELTMIRDIGCPMAQGYYFGKAMPFDQAEVLVK
ncbi:MAG: cyclic nucleotide-binding protein [Micavibrio sp.]|mgnify:CR=1 FL=1|nr:cyclic nucleotide-binding protein [Micavibrio sp.]